MVSRYTSPKKTQARDLTVLAFRSSLVGTSRQYWTLAGPCGQDGQVIEGSEFCWAVRQGLVAPDQFHGVDYDPDVAAQNQTLGQGHWYRGDFLEVMRDQDAAGDFHPGLINYDSLVMPAKGTPYFAQVLYLARHQNDCVVVGNFVTRSRYWQVSYLDVIGLLQQEPLFVGFFRTGNWNLHGQAYCYNGSGKRNTTEMCSVIFTTSPQPNKEST